MRTSNSSYFLKMFPSSRRNLTSLQDKNTKSKRRVESSEKKSLQIFSTKPEEVLRKSLKEENFI